MLFRSAALGLTLGGLPGVLIAAFIVKSLPLVWLRWLVVIVVSYAAVLMLRSAARPAPLAWISLTPISPGRPPGWACCSRKLPSIWLTRLHNVVNPCVA